MSVGTAGAIIGGGLAAAGSVGAAVIGSGASGRAADAATAGQNNAIAAQTAQSQKAQQFLMDQATQSRADLQPFVNSQTQALGQLSALADPNSSLAQQQRTVATQAIQRQLAAQGLLRSKQQPQLLGNFELGLAQQRAGILQGLAGSGAAQSQAQLSSNLGGALASNAQGLGQQLGSSFQNIGQIGAQNQVNQGQFASGGLGGFLGGIAAPFQQQSQFQQLQQILAASQGNNAGSNAVYSPGPVPSVQSSFANPQNYPKYNFNLGSGK